MAHGPASVLGERLLRVERGEWPRVLASAAYFALVLFGYFLLRPVREAMGVVRSMDDLRWLFVATCVASLAAALAFGAVVSRLDRVRFITVGHVVIAACLLVFVAVRPLVDDDARVILGYVFFVWLSVVNLFLTSVFWAFMADVWTLEAGKRVFAIIAVGGTLGALAGSTFAAQLAESIGVSWQLSLAALCFVVTTPIVLAIDRGDRASRAARADLKDPAAVNARSERAAPADRARERAPPVRVGGRWIEGVTLLCRSPYLLGTAIYVVLLTVSTTLLYFTRAELVVNARAELEARISAFAQMDAWTQGATLFVQLFVTGHLIRRLGVGITLAILPIVSVAGFAALAWLERRPGVEGWQLFGAVTAFSAVHSAARFAVARPTRETLFNVVSVGEKYKAKPVIDLFVYRSGDVAGAWATSLVAGMWGMFMLALPLGAIWGGMCIWLAAAQRRRAESAGRERSRPPTDQAAAAAEGVVA